MVPICTSDAEVYVYLDLNLSPNLLILVTGTFCVALQAYREEGLHRVHGGDQLCVHSAHYLRGILSLW